MGNKETDGTEHAFAPRELPRWAFQMVGNVPRPLPLFIFYEFTVAQKETRDVAEQENVESFALHEIITRNFKLRRVVDVMRSKAGGRVLSRKESLGSGVKKEQMLAIPTKPADGRSTGYLTGHCCH